LEINSPLFFPPQAGGVRGVKPYKQIGGQVFIS
jgi:hypothetical protein